MKMLADRIEVGTIEVTSPLEKTLPRLNNKVAVILLNDDATEMQYVVIALLVIFSLDLKESKDTMIYSKFAYFARLLK